MRGKHQNDLKGESGKRQLTKSGLAILLSKLEVFTQPQVRCEQYVTDPEIAAEVLWQAYLRKDLQSKVSADLGCGTGMLGIGLLLLGAGKVYLVDSDKEALKAAKSNLKLAQSESSVGLGEARFRNLDVSEFDEKVDLVAMNPPFGSKVRHMDRVFLKKALEIAPLVYSFHKSESYGFINAFARDSCYAVTNRFDFEFPLKATQKYHKRRIFRIKVSCYRLQRI